MFSLVLILLFSEIYWNYFHINKTGHSAFYPSSDVCFCTDIGIGRSSFNYICWVKKKKGEVFNPIQC